MNEDVRSLAQGQQSSQPPKGCVERKEEIRLYDSILSALDRDDYPNRHYTFGHCVCCIRRRLLIRDYSYLRYSRPKRPYPDLLYDLPMVG